MKLASNQKWDQVPLVLSEFPKLIPLVLLICWDLFDGDISSRQKLIDLLWKTNSSNAEVSRTWDPLLVDSCERLSYQMQLAWWCCAKFCKLDKDKQSKIYLQNAEGGTVPLSNFSSPFEIASAVVNVLREHSLLYTMRQCLPEIDREEMEEIIRSDPEKDQIRREKRYGDLVCVAGYYSLKLLFELLFEQINDKNDDINNKEEGTNEKEKGKSQGGND